MNNLIRCMLGLLLSPIFAQEPGVNPVVIAAVSLGANAVVEGKHEVDPGIQLTENMKAYVFGLSWPEKTLYRWTDRDSELGQILYSLDFSAPIERVEEDYYGIAAVAGCLVIADTEHGQLVVPPGEFNSIDPVVWFLDNDDNEGGHKVWAARKLRLSELLSGLSVQK